jgi:hypothetical protein
MHPPPSTTDTGYPLQASLYIHMYPPPHMICMYPPPYRYPLQAGQPIACTCTLPSLLDQNDRVQGFKDSMAWIMIAIRKTEGKCYSDEEWKRSVFENRPPVECNTHGQCVSTGPSNARCVCDVGFWGGYCQHECGGCYGHGACDPDDGACQCFDTYFGADCSTHPNISSIEPSFSTVLDSLYGATTVTVQGRGFGSSDSSPRVRVGNTMTRRARWTRYVSSSSYDMHVSTSFTDMRGAPAPLVSKLS